MRQLDDGAEPGGAERCPEPQGCPSEAELAALCEGRLSGRASAEIDRHAAVCRGCHAVLDALGYAETEPSPDSSVDERIARALLGGGTTIGGSYRLVRVLGAGGMGAVYEAERAGTGERVAVKLIKRRLLGRGSEAPSRFRREARAAGALDNPHIVRVLDSGVDGATAHLYLVMERLHGEDLRQLIDRVGPLRPAAALRVAAQALSGLVAAHAAGIVHRDIKPDNLFLARGAGGKVTVKLLDFGIAKIAEGRGAPLETTGLTDGGGLLGSPLYMSPEQVRNGKEVDARADLWSLGCALYCALSGRAPHAGAPSVGALLLAICGSPAPALHETAPWVEPQVAEVVHRAIAIERSARYPSAAAMLGALRPLIQGDPSLREEMLVGLAPAGVRGFRPIEHSSPVLPRPPGPPAALPEQQLMSVVLARIAPEDRPALVVDLRRDLEGHGAQLEVLDDGALVATLLHAGAAATDQAARAARCAMLIKDRWPGATIALGTGSGLGGEPDGARGGAGLAFDRARALLREHGSDPGDGRIMIDEVTRSLLDARFVIERTPAGVHMLTGDELSVDATRPLLGKPTPCVGREAELALLEASLAACIEEREPRAAIVKAPPGVGKSRLWHELVRRLTGRGADVAILIGRADPVSAGTSYGLFGQAVRRLAGIAPGESLEVRREKLARRVGERAPADQAARVVAFVGELASVPFPDEHDPRLRAARQDPVLMSTLTTAAALDFLRAECAARPVLLVLEDLQWGDALTVKLCGRALRELPGSALMVLALARPEVDELFPGLWASTGQVMPLSPLSRKAGERLARQVLGPDVSLETVATIVAQSEGNALFLEELIRAAAEGRRPEASGTVLALMQARIGRLPAGARRVLRAASVFGEAALLGGVQALCDEGMSDEEVCARLSLLCDEEILEARRGGAPSPTGDEAYRFRHALVRDAAYSLGSEQERTRSHHLAGEYLAERGAQGSLTVAEHFVLGADPRRAAPHFLRAGEESFDANDTVAALSSARRGLACGPEGELRGGLLDVAAAASIWSEQFGEVIARGTEALDLLEPGTRRWLRSFRHVCVAATFTRGAALLDGLAARHACVEPRPDTRDELVQGTTWLASMLIISGLKDRGLALQRQAWQVAGPACREDRLTWGHLASMDAFNGFFVAEAPWTFLTGLVESERALFDGDEHHYRALLCAYRGRVLYDLGDEVGALAGLREVVTRAERADDVAILTYGRSFLAHVLARVAEVPSLDEPERLAHAVVAAKNAMFTGDARGSLAEIQRRRGDLSGAEREARLACEAVRPFPVFAWKLVALHARVLLEQGRAEEALAVAEGGVLDMERLGLAGHGEIDLRLALVEALHAAGRPGAARAALSDLLPRLAKRAADIPDPQIRARYLGHVAVNARVSTLAGACLGDPA